MSNQNHSLTLTPEEVLQILKDSIQLTKGHHVTKQALGIAIALALINAKLLKLGETKRLSMPPMYDHDAIVAASENLMKFAKDKENGQ